MTYYFSLNPYSTGIWSATVAVAATQNSFGPVLILILLEYGLRPYTKINVDFCGICLNPYSTGIWSATCWCFIH